jgi:hypothetical protein
MKKKIEKYKVLKQKVIRDVKRKLEMEYEKV